jgi:uncharacterized membrane protein YphA (DoxX/SURF4 family)
MAPSRSHNDVAPRPPAPRSGNQFQAAAVIVLRVSIGVFMFFFGVEKASWVLDATAITSQLGAWLADAPPISRWYLERIIPGAPLFARMVPLGSMSAGIALALGLWTRIAAAVALVMVLSLQLAEGAMFRYAYLADASGLPLAGGLLALIVAGERRT